MRNSKLVLKSNVDAAAPCLKFLPIPIFLKLNLRIKKMGKIKLYKMRLRLFICGRIFRTLWKKIKKSGYIWKVRHFWLFPFLVNSTIRFLAIIEEILERQRLSTLPPPSLPLPPNPIPNHLPSCPPPVQSVRARPSWGSDVDAQLDQLLLWELCVLQLFYPSLWLTHLNHAVKKLCVWITITTQKSTDSFCEGLLNMYI